MKLSKNGLPVNLKYCKKCNISNQLPLGTNEYFHTKDTIQKTIEFDEDGICAACNFNKLKWDNTIDWKEREKELIELCDKKRKKNGEYDCIVGGSGGKDSVFQSYELKYKYNMNPLTVTWTPHIYTSIGWTNFQNWINVGGFDNYLFTPNGKVQRKFTREATINLMHPFQPFILGQKTFVLKMAHKFDIPLIFYGENPGEYGRKIGYKEKKYQTRTSEPSKNAYVLDPLNGKKFEDAYIGGKKVAEYIDEGMSQNDILAYKPLSPEIIENKNIEIYYFGYFRRFVPQENFYYATKNTNFQVNPERTEGTYSKYNSIDDKVDGFHYYTRYLKFGIGRAMFESAQEIRNGHLNKEEGLALIEKFDGEYPQKFEKEFLDYISMNKDEFMELSDKYRPEHIWTKKSNRWVLKVHPSDFFKKS